ncbi:alanine--tRNA ligase [Candidatus Shapirobacteria bacterium]|nr:alanine--tRNA ligase [Candidatus Shapirobacteria bacterium]
MKSKEIVEKFINFFSRHQHQVAPQISLVPENDPTLLFTSAGMVQFKPYFLGKEEPPARRLVNVQRCLRTTDLERVGGNRRTLSFFEMLGSWSIGDYFKKEAVALAWEFLTKEIGLPPEKLWATYFAGDKALPQITPDTETPQAWQAVGVGKDHLVGLGAAENFWQVGESGPCGPCTEVYLDQGREWGCGRKDCQPGCDCDRFLEIWNAGVFMEYNRTLNGQYEILPLKSVDTGAGLERMAMVLQEKESVFETDLLWPIIQKIESLSNRCWEEEKSRKAMAIIADHLRASVFLIADGVLPSNLEQGYVLRRLIRRASWQKQKLLGGEKKDQPLFLPSLVTVVEEIYRRRYPFLSEKRLLIENILEEEEKKFREALSRGQKEIRRLISFKREEETPLGGGEAFHLLTTFGLPQDLVLEEFVAAGVNVSPDFEEEFAKASRDHQKKSRTTKKFKGGLEDHSLAVTKLHTATHLLHQALRYVLGESVHQAGSNITPDRLRFDFPYPQKLTGEQIKKVESLVNKKIKEDLPVSFREVSLEEAKKMGALAFFEGKYDKERVKVYTIGNEPDFFSREVCGGPHVKRTGALGKFKIIKEESIGSGKRRIYGMLE